MSFLNRLREGLAKTRSSLTQKIETILTGKSTAGEAALEEIEEILITADTGVETAMRLTDSLRREMRSGILISSPDVKAKLQEEIQQILTKDENTGLALTARPSVIMVVGVNGVGKTTTIAKLAHLLKSDGHKLILAAADTFRAAAIDQLTIWGERIGIPVIRHREGADPAAVVFDAIQAAKAREVDVVIADTAGRLHTKANLMAELKKIRRVIEREIPGGPQETLLVLDATTGQNAVSQARLFDVAVGVSGIVLTKLDGTAKGGIVIAIRDTLHIPLKFIGVGEGLEDLRPFDANEFVAALFAD
ncbi:MAG: signal recognition particle-docking protein FtsY [bacterium]